MLLIRNILFVILCVGACGCRRDACAELRKAINDPYWPGAATNLDCRAELEAANIYAKNANLSPRDWYLDVRGQQVMLVSLLRVAEAKRLSSRGDLLNFDRFPKSIPCSAGTSISNKEWAASPLGILGIARPDDGKLYSAFEVTSEPIGERRDSFRLSIRVLQDLNCDGQAVSGQETGILRGGSGSVQERWKLTSTVPLQTLRK